jgi:hypothetical protein
MSENKKEWAAILSKANTKTKVLALVLLVAGLLFSSSLVVLRDRLALYALFVCAGILLATVVGIVVTEVTEARAPGADQNRLRRSDKTPPSEFLDEIINSAIQTVCRAASLPQTPQAAKLRVFIFRKNGNQLVCSHFWSQDPVTEQVGKLRFDLNLEVAKKVAVVRAAMDNRICRTTVEPLPQGANGVAGDVADDLNFVLAAPIQDSTGDVWGTVDFDAASEAGKALLSNEVSNAVMFQLARHLSVIFELGQQPPVVSMRQRL